MPQTLLFISLLSFPLIGQGFHHTFGGSFNSSSGNTDYKYYHLNYQTEALGNVKFGNFSLIDTEFLFAVNRSISEWNKLPYENDANGILKVDLWANGKISPFLFSEVSFDSTQGLDNRTNIGAGFKYRVWGNILSVSYAIMYENEKYTGWPGESFTRHSIRPKFKKKFENGLFFQSQIFYKPTTDNNQYLLDWRNNIAMATKAEWLSITLDYYYQFNSNPAIMEFYYDESNNIVPVSYYKKEDTTLAVGISVTL